MRLDLDKNTFFALHLIHYASKKGLVCIYKREKLETNFFPFSSFSRFRFRTPYTSRNDSPSIYSFAPLARGERKSLLSGLRAFLVFYRSRDVPLRISNRPSINIRTHLDPSILNPLLLNAEKCAANQPRVSPAALIFPLHVPVIDRHAERTRLLINP